MTPLATLPPALPPERGPGRATDRRAVGRAVAGGLAALAVAPAVAPAAPAAAAEKKAKGKKKFHRCKVHKKHTCWHARTCRHRLHKPGGGTDPNGPGGTGGTDPGAPPPGTPAPPGAYDQPAASGGVPTVLALHLASRVTYGMTPGLLAEMAAYPTLQAWLDAQLRPEALPDPQGDAVEAWWPSLAWSPQEMWARDKATPGAAWHAMADYQRWCLLRRITSRRQLLESVTEFFEDHLHVPVHDDGVFGYRTDYGRTIRRHALGRFDDMLVATTVHPAMSISLDNANSTKRAPNENLGRELLELHTVGRGNFSEADVKVSARILTGYRVDMWRTWNASYDPASHWTGQVDVLGFSHANAAPDGRPVVEAFLRHLARQPATAKRLARKLAVRYVSDDPSPGLVDALASAYLTAETAIVPVLRTLFAHPEFQAAQGTKVRTPADDVVATWRALGVQPQAPTGDGSAVNQILWQTTSLGQAPFDWARPDGQPQQGAAWSSVSRVLASFDAHYAMAGTWWPSGQAVYKPLASWVPLQAGQSMRFDALVEHLSRNLLGRPAPDRLVEACCQASGLTRSTSITLGHSLVRWGMPVLLSTVLDSPEHMHR